MKDELMDLPKKDPTRRVKKWVSRVIIVTDTDKIEGNMHGSPTTRLTDLLNSDTLFIPVTDAVLFERYGDKELSRAKFLSLNKNVIRMVMELED
ncbi:MAG: DUF6812 domain-containing protein [Eubacteriales bacterium]